MNKIYLFLPKITFVLGLICFFASCKTLNPSSMFETEKQYAYADFNQEHKEYVIRPFDKLDVRIYTNDGHLLVDTENSATQVNNTRNLNPYLVEANGEAKLPIVGRTPVEGLTIKEVEDLLEDKFSQFYQNPFVLVNVTNRRVVVFSAGSQQGTVLNIENEQFTLIEALAQAGGIDDFSKAHRIKLLRGDLNEPLVFLYDISSIEEMKKANMILQANDIIYVERRPRYASKTLNELMPYITLLNTFILLYVTIVSI